MAATITVLIIFIVLLYVLKLESLRFEVLFLLGSTANCYRFSFFTEKRTWWTMGSPTCRDSKPDMRETFIPWFNSGPLRGMKNQKSCRFPLSYSIIIAMQICVAYNITYPLFYLFIKGAYILQLFLSLTINKIVFFLSNVHGTKL